jgi:CAAX prenyl protease-like protein
MSSILDKLRSTATVARVAPFIVFAAVTSAQGMFGEEAKYWFYVVRSLAGAWLVWAVWPVVKEMRWTISVPAVLVGIGVCVMWVGIDQFYPKFVNAGKPWNPHLQFGEGSALAWFFIAARILGSSIVVPPIEEMFYRSFLYRYVMKPDFEKLTLAKMYGMSFVITSVFFGIVHREWLAGILCGFAYQWLVIRKGHLGDAMTAHAITNFLLGVYIVYKGAWQFW